MSSVNRRTLFRNFNYRSDTEYVVKVAKFLLTPVGIWPLYGNDTTFDRIKITFQTSFVFSLMCFLLVPHIIYTFFDAEDLTRYMKVIAAQVFSLLGIMKFWTMIINRNEIKSCLQQMEIQYRDVESEEDRLVMIRNAKVGRQFTFMYLGLLYGGALPYHIIMPLVADKIVKEDNTTHLPLPYLSDYIFFVVENSPFYEILFVTQILFSTIILSTNCGVYSLIATCVMHACCLFEVARRHMEMLLVDGTDNLNERFGRIIVQHMRALRFVEMIENSLNIVFLSEMVGCTIIICFLEYGVLKEWEDKQVFGTIIYFILVVSILVNVFTLSCIGDRLKEESSKIGETSYFIDWYELPAKNVSNLIMVMVRSNRPSTLTAAKMFDISLQSFCDVCKTSAAYFNFIRMITTRGKVHESIVGLSRCCLLRQFRIKLCSHFPPTSRRSSIKCMSRMIALIIGVTAERILRMLTNNSFLSTSAWLPVGVQLSLRSQPMQAVAIIMGESKSTVQNDERLLDFHYAAQISLRLLKPIGAWPLQQQATKLETIMHGLAIVIATFLQLFMIVPWLIRIVIAKWSFYDIIKTACPLIFAVTVFLRYLLLLFHRDEIRSCIDRVAEDWRNVTVAEDREIMLANARSGRLFGIISVAFMFGSGVLYCIMPVAISFVVTKDNVTVRLLPNPCELLMDVQVGPICEAVYAMEFLSCCTMYTVFCGICSLTAKFVTHACGQCEIMTYVFAELVEGGERNQGTIDQRIGNAVVRHLRILRFVSDVDKVLNEICLAEIINASCNICLLGYYVIMDWNNHESILQIFVYFLAFISITFNIYIFCYIGERLVDRCQRIGTMCYMIEWYRLPQNKARSLIFPIIMSNYPIELTAGKMLTMTMSSFSNILRTSMAYFNLLRELASREIM